MSTSDISGTITKVVVNASTASGVTATVGVTIDGDAFGGDVQSLTSSAANYTFEGSASGDIVVTVTKPSKATKALYVKSITVTYTSSGSGGSNPSISADNVNIAQDATNGSIAYTLNNATGNVSASITSGDWLTLGTITATAVPFTCSANTGAERTATVTLSFTGATDKVVTITQAAKTVASPTFNPEGGSYMQGTGITLTSEGNTIYYTIKTDGTTPSDPTVNSTRYTAPISLSIGTTKIKAIAYDTYGNASSIVSRTYTGIALASLPFSWTGTGNAGKAELAKETGVTVSLASDYAESNAPYRLKFDGVGKNVTIYFNEKPETVYFTAKLFNATTTQTGSKIKVQGSADGITFTDIEEFTIKGAANATFEFTTSNSFVATHRAVKLVMSSKDQNVGVGTISISCLPVKISSAEYATFSNAHVLDFSNTGIKVFTAKDNETSVTLSEVTTGKVPANTPVVLYKAGGATINVPVIASAPAISGTNDLRVSDGTTTLTNAYVLAMNPTIGFYPWDGTTLSAGKIYLQGSGSNTRDFIGIGDASSISNVKVNTNLDGKYYDLQGRQVAQPTKGLYIVNGKKVFVK